MTGKDVGCLSATVGEKASRNKDLLWGAAAITAFVNELSSDPMSLSKIYHLIESGDLPAGRLGGRLVGSKQRIREHFERITSG
jgi:hypothetical protein